MVDIIILIIVAVVLIFAIKGTLKHFKGEGACCGGAKREIKKKLNDPILYEKDYKISGMHCANCATKVQNELNKIDGVKAIVSFKEGKAHISFSRSIDERILQERVQKIGYTFSS